MTNEDIIERGVMGLVNLFITHYLVEPSVAEQAEWIGVGRITGFVKLIPGVKHARDTH